jgi:hypothetical protein
MKVIEPLPPLCHGCGPSGLLKVTPMRTPFFDSGCFGDGSTLVTCGAL